MVRVGVVLSGCGYQDGAEIHEAVLAGYFLEKEGAELAWCAPDVEQQGVDLMCCAELRRGQAAPGAGSHPQTPRHHSGRRS